MIVYNPVDGEAITSGVKSAPRCCFLMTRLGKPIDPGVTAIRDAVIERCINHGYTVIDASTKVTGRDFLVKIWRQIASVPLAIGVCHEGIPAKTQFNIYYELGVAQAMGKETVLIKSEKAEVPSDFVRTEYIRFDGDFSVTFDAFMTQLTVVAEHYEQMADQLDRNPVLALDYFRRAFLITGDARLQRKAKKLLTSAGLGARAKNSVELLAASF